MIAYIIRRALYAIPTLIGVNIFVFILFFIVNTPDDMARTHLGAKRANPEAMDTWKAEHDLNLPMFYNEGWIKLASTDASKPAKVQFDLPQAGDYRLIIKAPKLSQELQKSISRKVSVSFSDDKSVQLQSTLKADQLCPDYKSEQIIELSSSANNQHINCNFDISEKNARHQLTLEYKDDIAFGDKFSKTIFNRRSLKMLAFDYGKSDKGLDIGEEVSSRMLPSLLITLPALVFGALVNIIFAMLLAANRGNKIDVGGTIICVVLMSISALFYIIGGQWFFGSELKLVPVSGFDMDSYSMRFMILPVAIIIMSGFGASTRFYRTLFLEEINQLYIKTARAKGLSETRILFVHLLKNAMIPILTGLVVQLPFLFIGSLLIENFFAIPGMGSFTVEAIKAQDFASVQAMVSLGSFLYIGGLLLTDIAYGGVDPRVKLGGS